MSQASDPDPGGEPPVCQHCGAGLDEALAREHRGVRRLGCLACGVQLVCRPGQPWETIRG